MKRSKHLLLGFLLGSLVGVVKAQQLPTVPYSSGGSSSGGTGTITGSLTSGRIVYSSGASSIADSANLLWNNTNQTVSITGKDGTSTLLFPTVTYTSNMGSLPFISIIATENTSAGTHDYLKMVITRTAGEYNYLNFLGGAAGSTAIFSIDRAGNITASSGGSMSGTGSYSAVGDGAQAFKTASAYAANQRVMNVTGTGASSNTGSNAVSSFDLAHTLNTSGVPSVFKLAVTDTQHGTNTRLFSILGGASATTDEFYIYTDGAVYLAGNLTQGNNTSNLVWGTLFQLTGSTGKFTTYNGITTISNGIPSELATIDLTAQTAAISATALYTPTASGMFRVCAVLHVTTAGSVSSILGGTTGITLAYTEPDGSVAQTAFKMALDDQNGAVVTVGNGNTTNTTQATSQGCNAIYAKTGVAITYAVGYTSVNAAEMNYSLHMKVEAM